MSELLKKEYELSLWSEQFIYLGTDGIEYELASDVPDGESVKNQYVRETKIAIIGADTLDTPIRAFDPKLTRNVNGTNTLTFQIYHRYYDEEVDEFKLNPFTNLLVNERKIKLYYDGEWFDFIIKEIQEKSDGNVFTYTCKDQYITELSRTGYEVELDTELENNMGSVTELAGRILEGSDWRVNERGSELIQQTHREKVMKYVLQYGETWNLTGLEYSEDGLMSRAMITRGTTVYLFYSDYIENNIPFQAILIPGNDELLVDENNTIVNGERFLTTDQTQFPVDAVPTNFYGEKLISKALTTYVSEIDKFCTLYTKQNNAGTWEDYYAYTENEYASPAEVQNLIVNNEELLTTNGWVSEGGSTTVAPAVGGTSIMFDGSNGVYNTGFYDHRKALGGLVIGERFIFALKLKYPGQTWDAIKIVGKKAGETSYSDFFNFSRIRETSKYPVDKLANYDFFEATSLITLSYSELLEYDTRLVLELKNSFSAILIEDAKLFKGVLGSDNKWIIPDLSSSTNSIVRTKYYFFSKSQLEETPQKVFGIDDLTFSHILYEDEIAANGYVKKESPNFEKIRSIKGSKSNRFNLIQELCETFECWAKFDIEHDARGAITHRYESLNGKEIVAGSVYYEADTNITGAPSDGTVTRIIAEEPLVGGSNHYQRLTNKWVTFKKYIGAENHAGFRYGINLKSIQRTIKSDQITTRMIVEPNVTEYATGGVCSIQDAFLNPTMENVLYNFDYYIRQKLLLQEDLENDLYGFSGGLNLYGKLREWNQSIIGPIAELVELSNTINTLSGRKLTYETIVQEANSELAEIDADLAVARGESGNVNDNADYIKNLIAKRTKVKSTLAHYTGLLNENASLLSSYQEKYATLNAVVEQVAKKKKALSNEFYRKYSRYIQEGTWTSSEHLEPDEYYLDAEYVLQTSASPKVDYSINVLEVSQAEGYGSYYFRIGDKTYMEDTEFFGWDNKGRPYKEEIIISEVSYSLDDPSKNTIKVQNYKTQFEDLFQRVIATTQSLQFAEGRYERAAKAVESESFDSSLLQKSLLNNALILKNAKNESVVWDETGITLTNMINPNQIVRLVSGGIVLSVDGGRNWTTGITGTGINASVITAGRVDTNKIRIFNETMPTFEWDHNGISAYVTMGGSANGTPNLTQFVRFNQFGLFGGTFSGDKSCDTLTDVKKNAIFSLTWDGLRINIDNQEDEVINIGDNAFVVKGNGTVNIKTPKALTGNDKIINVNDNFIVYSDGSISANSGTFKGTVKAATFEGASTGAIFGPQLGVGFKTNVVDNEANRETLSNYNFQVDSSGNVTMNGNITLSGKISWNASSSPTKVLYCQTNISAPTSAYDNYDSTATNLWHKTLMTNDYYASYSYSGGAAGSWTAAIKIKGSDGAQGAQGPQGPQGPQGLPGDYYAPSWVVNTVIQGDYIITPLLRANYISLSGNFYMSNNCSIGPAYGDSGGRVTYGVAITSQYGNAYYGSDYPYIIVTSDGCRMTCKSGFLYVIDGGPHASHEIKVDSDARLKNTILYDLEKYEGFFDDLKPATFYYNSHTHKKRHLGLIAQDVESIIEKNGLTPDDLALLSLDTSTREGVLQETYSLAYGELISLCIYKIQKLQKEIESLKNLQIQNKSDII